jgi:hypothetical protein
MRALKNSVPIAAVLLLTSCAAPQRATSSNPTITPPPEVLMQAAQAHFPYAAVLRSAERGDGAALLSLIRFSPHTDAYGCIAHGVVLLELRQIYGARAFSRIADGAGKTEREAAMQDIDAAASVLNGPKV